MTAITSIGVPVEHVLALAIALFFIGLLGMVFKKSIVFMLMSIEIMLNAGNLLFVVFAEQWADLNGQAVAFFMMAIAAAEAAVGLAIMIGVFRTHETLEINSLKELRE